MAVSWLISHDEKLVVVQITDAFVLEDIPDAYAAVIAEGGLSYRKLIDLSLAPLDVCVLDISGISSAIRAVAGDARRGPVACVVPNDAVHDMVEIFDRKTDLDRPLGIFRDKASATRWLDEIAPVSIYK